VPIGDRLDMHIVDAVPATLQAVQQWLYRSSWVVILDDAAVARQVVSNPITIQ
jgi:hypothetical protein